MEHTHFKDAFTNDNITMSIEARPFAGLSIVIFTHPLGAFRFQVSDVTLWNICAAFDSAMDTRVPGTKYPLPEGDPDEIEAIKFLHSVGR